MESSITGNLSKSSQTLADKAADKVQGGIRDARHAAKEAADAVTDAATDAAQRTRDVAAHTAGSIVRYTKKNPMTALMIAAASGALLLGLINVLKPSRD
jgi:ElaB/YqjD/DUF883 family membrane-anchored ribosome-binding protein